MARKWRSGSVYPNHMGTIVNRRKHLYTAPESENTQPALQRYPHLRFPEKANAKQRQKLKEAVNETFDKLASSTAKTSMFFELEKNRAKWAIEEKYSGVNYEIKLYERMQEGSFSTRRQAKRNFEKALRENKSIQVQEILGEEFNNLLDKMDTKTLILERDDMVMKVLELVHAGKDDNDSAVQLSSAVAVMTGISSAIMRRVGDFDEDAINYVKNLPDASFEWARKEREIYGENFMSSWKEISAVDAMEELGCDEDTLVVYLWSGFVDRVITQDEMIYGQEKSVSKITLSAQSVAIMKEEMGGGET